MRRYATTLLVLLALAVPSAGALGLDVVVMVDTSQSMFPVFDDLVHYVFADILEKRLRPGDTFHLLSFASTPEEELSVTITDTTDLTRVIARILLLEPLGLHTDLVAAVRYLYAYTAGLPDDNRKLVMLLTDGIHDPPPGSPDDMDPARVLAELLKDARRIHREGWEVDIIRTPYPQGQAGAPPPATPKGAEEYPPDYLEEMAEELGTRVIPYKPQAGEGMTDEIPGLPARRPQAAAEGGGASTAPAPAQAPQGAAQAPQGAKQPAPPRRGQPGGAPALPPGSPAASGRITLQGIPAWILYLVLALVAAALIVAIVLILRHQMQDRTFDRFFRGLTGFGGRTRVRPLIMRVAMQNPNIGSRNIHSVPPGSSRSVGGDGSTFLIYFVPVPRRIGDVRNDGKRYLFVPRRPEYFPQLDGPVPDCIGTPLHAVSQRGRPLTFTFEEYISPVEEINRLMRSVKQQGATQSRQA